RRPGGSWLAVTLAHHPHAARTVLSAGLAAHPPAGFMPSSHALVRSFLLAPAIFRPAPVVLARFLPALSCSCAAVRPAAAPPRGPPPAPSPAPGPRPRRPVRGRAARWPPA